MRPKVLLDEDHAGRAGLRGDAERSNGSWDVDVGCDRGRHGADERQVQGNGRAGVSGCGEGEGE